MFDRLVNQRYARIVEQYQAAKEPQQFAPLPRALTLIRPFLPTWQRTESRLLAAICHARAGDTAHAAKQLFIVLKKCLQMSAPADATERPSVVTAAAVLALEVVSSRHDETIALLDLARRALGPYPPDDVTLQVLRNLGHTYYLAGNNEEALIRQEQALAIAVLTADEQEIYELTNNVAQFASNLNDHRRAARHYRSLMKLARDDAERRDILIHLGVECFSSGQPREATRAFGEARRLHLSSDTADFVAAGEAAALVDLKKFDEATALLSSFRDHGDASFTESRRDLERRIARETAGPLALDCLHRVVSFALTDRQEEVRHQNTLSSISAAYPGPIPTSLSADERNECEALEAELNQQWMTTQWMPSSDTTPQSFMTAITMRYVDDIERFEIAWATFKAERERAKRLQELLVRWEETRNAFARKPAISGDDIPRLLEYLFSLAELVSVYAEMGERARVREIALHVADFLEAQAPSADLAALLWSVRANILTAIHPLADSTTRDFVEIELRRSLDRLRETTLTSDAAIRSTFRSHLIATCFAAGEVLGATDGYNHLLDVVEPSAQLDEEAAMRYAIAHCQCGELEKGVRLIDDWFAGVTARHPNVRIFTPPTWDVARAVSRFRLRCSTAEACRNWLGPFAEYIASEVAAWTSRKSVLQEPSLSTPIRVLAFSEMHLNVIDKSLGGADVTAAILHESLHHLRRSGQQLQTSEGRWLMVKRDVPVAAAETFLQVRSVPQIQELMESGQHWAQRDRERCHAYVKNMLRYYDDLAWEEPPSSYACAAILIGIADVFLSRDKDAVTSYIHHLKVVDHDEALEYGRRHSDLRL